MDSVRLCVCGCATLAIFLCFLENEHTLIQGTPFTEFMENKKTTHKEEISRKDAIKKMGKYAALTAIGSFTILNPKKAQAMSPADPGSGWS